MEKIRIKITLVLAFTLIANFSFGQFTASVSVGENLHQKEENMEKEIRVLGDTLMLLPEGEGVFSFHTYCLPTNRGKCQRKQTKAGWLNIYNGNGVIYEFGLKESGWVNKLVENGLIFDASSSFEKRVIIKKEKLKFPLKLRYVNAVPLVYFQKNESGDFVFKIDGERSLDYSKDKKMRLFVKGLYKGT